jgi:hypothetical protein
MDILFIAGFAAISTDVEAGHSLIHEARTEPWGQTIARLSGPKGSSSGSATHHSSMIDHPSGLRRPSRDRCSVRR